MFLCIVFRCFVFLCFVFLCFMFLCFVFLCFVFLCFVFLCFVFLCFVFRFYSFGFAELWFAKLYFIVNIDSFITFFNFLSHFSFIYFIALNNLLIIKNKQFLHLHGIIFLPNDAIICPNEILPFIYSYLIQSLKMNEPFIYTNNHLKFCDFESINLCKYYF